MAKRRANRIHRKLSYDQIQDLVQLQSTLSVQEREMIQRKSLGDSVRKSARLRNTLDVARLAGFDYDLNSKNRYGGFFNVYQLEVIVKALSDYARLREKNERA